MPLAEYLASEQAREDVRDLLDGDKPSLPVMSMEDLCLVRDEVGAWRSVMIWDDNQNKELTAYYLPYGDRYVVTDLGEGVRALRLRTGAQQYDAEQTAHKTLSRMFSAKELDGRTGPWTASGVLSLLCDEGDIPECIRRVMLASLRVAQS